MSRPVRPQTEFGELFVQCRARWPGLADRAAQAAFEAALRAQSGEDDFHAEDLWLAIACARGDQAALATFEESVLPKSMSGVARIDSSRAFADEVAQTVRMRLFAPATGEPRITEYTGRGPLANWTRAVALRCALNLRRGKRPILLGDKELERAAGGDGPELSLLKANFRREFKAAFVAAVASLEPRDRSLLRLHLVEGVTLDRLARTAGVHRATIVRRLATARGLVLARTRTRLSAVLDIRNSEIVGMIEHARSQLDVTLERVLRTIDPSAPASDPAVPG